MKRLIKRILSEHKEFKNKLFNLLKSGQDKNIELVKPLSKGQGYDLIELLLEYFQEYGGPYFLIMDILELSEEEQLYIISKLFVFTEYIMNATRKITIDDVDIIWDRIQGLSGHSVYLSVDVDPNSMIDQVGYNIYLERYDEDGTIWWSKEGFDDMTGEDIWYTYDRFE